MKRDASKKMIFGVCAGLAKELNVDVVIVRAIFLLGAFLGFGMPVIIYFVLAILMPVE
jgi:phage shock protein PspC (stress-responsive transcriptional regulator)